MDDRLASDFVALWQSELTAMAGDRELRESWAALLALWASSGTAALAALPRHSPPPRQDALRNDGSSGGAGAAQPARAAAADAASEPGLAAIERLDRRIAELERQLAQYAAAGGRPA